MAFNFKKFWAGLNIVPKSVSTADSKGDLEVLSSDGKLYYHNGSTVSAMVTESQSGTITNKTYVSGAASPATAGVLRLGNNESIGWRNFADSANKLLTVNSTDQLQYDGDTLLTSTGSLTANRALQTDGSSTITSSTVLASELAFLSGATSNIQTQINTKAPSASPTLTGTVTVNGTEVIAAANELRFNNAANTFYVGFKGGNAVASTTFTLPLADGANRTVLTTDGAGNLSFTDPTAFSARYSTLGTTHNVAVPNNVITLINFGTLVFDANSRVTTGASWKYTATSTGKYNVSIYIRYTNAGWPALTESVAYLYKNGVQYAVFDSTMQQAAATVHVVNQGSMLVDLSATDFIDIRVIQISGGAVALDGALSSHVSINRVGP